MHEILIRRDDGDVAALLHDLLGVGCDEIVGLVAELLKAGDVERPHGLADQRELGHQFLGGRRPVRLVILIDVIPERFLGGIKHDGEMSGRFGRFGLHEKLPQHGAKAMDGADRHSVRRPRKGRQRVKCPENVARSID